MRVIVCGGRNFDDYALLESELDALHAQHRFTLVIHGAARGADSYADHWARSRHVDVEKYPAQWKVHGNRKAGPIRNTQMLVRLTDGEGLSNGFGVLVVAFPGGKGTADMTRQAEGIGVPVIRIRKP